MSQESCTGVAYVHLKSKCSQLFSPFQIAGRSFKLSIFDCYTFIFIHFLSYFNIVKWHSFILSIGKKLHESNNLQQPQYMLPFQNALAQLYVERKNITLTSHWHKLRLEQKFSQGLRNQELYLLILLTLYTLKVKKIPD